MMRTSRFLVVVLLSLGLALILLRALGGQRACARAGSEGPCWVRINDEPVNYGAVQVAVDAAQDGDVVKIAGYCAGVESRGGTSQTVYISKSLTLRGGYTTTWTLPNPDVYPTILDAQGQGRVLTIVGPSAVVEERISVTVEGLNVTGGDASGLGGGQRGRDAGGGIYVVNATATVSGSYISHSAAQEGGGLYAGKSSVDVQGSTVITNTAIQDGGGISLDRSSALLVRSIFRENHTGRWGGGIYLYQTNHVSIMDSAIVGNTSAGDGGGAHLNVSSVKLRGTHVRSNVAADDGGGVYVYRTQSTAIYRSEFLGNVAEDKGGAIHLREGDLRLANDILADNVADEGGGIYLDNASSNLVHTTIARNEGNSGICLVGQSTSGLTNTILVSHTVGIDVGDGSAARLVATLLGSGIWANQQDWKNEGVLLTDPRNYWDFPAFSAPDTGDYRIGPSSGAVNRGLCTEVSTDIDGDPRPVGPAPDLGADEIWQLYLPLALRVTGAEESGFSRGVAIAH